MTAGRDLLERRLEVAARGAVPSPPASRLLQRSGLEATIEQRLCGETLGQALLARADAPLQSLLVVDLSTTGRAAAVWLGHTCEFLARQHPGARVTLALPGTRGAGRGRLLERYLRGMAEKTGVTAELLCGPASVERSAPVGAEIESIRRAYDLIMVVALGGSAGIGAAWPAYPGARWLELADAAVLTFLDPDSLPADLDRLSLLDSGPPRIRIETLETDAPRLVGRVDIAQLPDARRELPHFIETARRRSWRAVVEPAQDRAEADIGPATLLACPSETAARQYLPAAEIRRSLLAGRLRLITMTNDQPSG